MGAVETVLAAALAAWAAASPAGPMQALDRIEMELATLERRRRECRAELARLGRLEAPRPNLCLAAYRRLEAISSELEDIAKDVSENPAAMLMEVNRSGRDLAEQVGMAGSRGMHSRTRAVRLREAAKELRAAFQAEYEQERRAGSRSRWGLAACCAAPLACIAAWFLRRRGRDSPIGRFKILRELGRGGMGVVYEAEDQGLGRRVALKRVRGESVMREARAAAALKHPNIVEIYAVVQDRSEILLVFELVAGPTLEALLRERGKLEPREALPLLRQVGAALDYAHARRVIHRDVKPSNILLGKEGAKLMDFGIAHVARETASRLTKTAAWGTPAYMAPEQALGEVCRESDLYALGVCVYEMLAGEPPFGGEDPLERRRRGVFAPIAGREAFFERALAPDPARRFHSAAEMAAAF